MYILRSNSGNLTLTEMTTRELRQAEFSRSEHISFKVVALLTGIIRASEIIAARAV